MKEIYREERFYIVELESERDIWAEGMAMGHCLAVPSKQDIDKSHFKANKRYVQALNTGLYRLFSVRGEVVLVTIGVGPRGVEHTTRYFSEEAQAVLPDAVKVVVGLVGTRFWTTAMESVATPSGEMLQHLFNEMWDV